MFAAQTQKMCCFLTQKCTAGWIWLLTAYSLDVEDIVVATQKAARRGAKTRVVADRRMSLGKGTRDMLASLKAMRASGAEVAFVNGKDIQAEYSAVGRSVQAGR